MPYLLEISCWYDPWISRENQRKLTDEAQPRRLMSVIKQKLG